MLCTTALYSTPHKLGLHITYWHTTLHPADLTLLQHYCYTIFTHSHIYWHSTLHTTPCFVYPIIKKIPLTYHYNYDYVCLTYKEKDSLDTLLQLWFYVCVCMYVLMGGVYITVYFHLQQRAVFVADPSLPRPLSHSLALQFASVCIAFCARIHRSVHPVVGYIVLWFPRWLTAAIRSKKKKYTHIV